MSTTERGRPPATILAIVGLAGTGKSTIVQLLERSLNAPVVYFGGVVIAEVQRRGLVVNETTEREVREELRSKHGMGAIALLAADAVARHASQGHAIVIVDGLYSYGEYQVLESQYHGSVLLIAVHAQISVRKERLGDRKIRPLTPSEITSRDWREISTLDKATPIAMADYHLVNDGSPAELADRLDRMIAELDLDQSTHPTAATEDPPHGL